MDYTVIDLSAHGPNRGLLLASESIHPTKAAPPLAQPETYVTKAATKDHVFCALTREFQIMRRICEKSGHSKDAVRLALRALVAQGFAEVRPVAYVSACQRTQIRAQWRRTR
jgi:hypothetical protein